jgi:Na+/melibiose symporter-like transporter
LSEAAAGPPGRLRLVDLILYALPGMGANFLFSLVLVMYMNFATDVLGVAASAVGAIFLACKVWDAISDPVVGRLSDRTSTKLGRRKSWLLASSVPLAITGLAMWAPPRSLDEVQLVVWISVSVFAFYTAYTLFDVPHMALGAELTFDARDRNRVFGVRQLFRTFGLFAAFGLGAAALEDQSQARDNARWMALAVGVFAAVTIWIAVSLLPKEPEGHQGRGGESPFRAMRDVWQNPHARLLLFVFFIEQLGLGGIGVLVPYAVRYVILQPDMISEILSIYVVSTVVSIPIWVWLGNRNDKRRLWLIAMFMGGVGFGLLILIGENTVGTIVVACILAGASSGCGPTLGQAIKADVIDWDEYHTGERKEGAYFAAWSFTSKLATGLMLGVVGFSLDFSGFDPTLPAQSELTQWTIRFLMGGVAMVGFAFGIMAFRHFALGPKEHQRIRAAIDRGETPGLGHTVAEPPMDR